ncbi:antibiotic biosynthesis monooxygenase [Sphaerisporangium rufum]|uniref:Antibiotic biosynthesis monooxygenase n=1 Tax=Sphaerisporangium rufum TaxID=1381558 RepID=A0A919UVT9_9ACTN|nr:antibiotic biosynthesis monooxygenase family protein [Sphaerisporangium rufum]GII75386.1 antibiotic biosynthesis monooxygenase [Sphaerisporangium rufum]
MLIVSGWIKVAPGTRDGYLKTCVEVVEKARAFPGCVDFAVSADLLDPDRVNVYEQWQSEVDLDAFRGSGPDDDQTDMITSAEVARHHISSTGPA